MDDGQVRVTRWTLACGDNTGLHQHEHDYVVVPIVDARITAVADDGTRTTSHLRAGVSYARPAGVKHTVSNESAELVDFVEVEILSTGEAP